MTNYKIRISAKTEDYNKSVADIFGCAFVFAAGTYVAKSIVIGLGAPQLELFAALLIYIGWFLILGRFLLENYSILPRIILVEVLFWGILYVSIYMFPETETIFNEYIMFLRRVALVFIPCGVICARCTDFEGIFIRARKYAYFGSILIAVSFSVGGMASIDYQSLGLYVTPFFLILYVDFLRNKTVLTTLLLVVDSVFALAGGRQSFIILLLGAVIIYLFENRKKPMKIVVALIVALIIILFFSLMLEPLLKGLIVLVNAMGLDDYMLSMLANGELLSTSTRYVIYESSVHIIQTNGHHLSGLFGSIYKIRAMYSWIAYPHNIIYDFLIDFGTILGGILLLLILYKFVRQIIGGDPERRLVLIFLADIAIVRLMVSSNYLIEGPFYILLIMLFSGNRMTKKFKVKGRIY